MPLESRTVSYGDSKALCEEIIREAQRQAETLLADANGMAQRIMEQARADAADFAAGVMADAEHQAAEQECKSQPAINIDVRRVAMDAREKLFTMVIEHMKNKASTFRQDGRYRDYLRRSIIEGARIVACPEMVVIGSHIDAPLFDDSFLNDASRQLKDEHGQTVSLTFVAMEGELDIGVMIQSRDKRILFDNRFLPVLARWHDRLHVDILKKVLE